jgi:hypothetical protein
MIISELFESPQQCPECGGISFSNLILAEKKDACYHKVKASAKVWPSAYASGRLVQCRKKGAGNYGNKSEGVMEMDKSQTPPGRDGSNDEGGKKEYTAKTITPKKAAKDGEKILNKIFNKKKGVAEEYDPYEPEAHDEFVSDTYYDDNPEDDKGVAEEYELAGVGVAYELGRRAYQERKTIRDNPYSATREARKHDEWEKGLERGKHDANDAKLFRRSVGEQGMAENAVQPLSVQQLATISDEALDKAYGYGRSTPGNTFGWQANLASAAYAKQAIDKGATDLIAISDAVHKGWWSVAQKFVDNPDQFSDTEKLRADGKFDKKMADRKAQMVPFKQLTKDQQDIDTVVARALLQAIRGEQGVAEGQLEMNTPDPVVVVQDLKGKILDKINLSVAAQKYKLGPPQNIKTQLAHQNYTKVGNYMIVSPMSGQPQDQTTTGQKQAITATEGEQQKGADYRDPKEVDYDDEYDSMVARVKRLAGLGPMKTVYDPNKRVYRNVPTAVQPPKK